MIYILILVLAYGNAPTSLAVEFNSLADCQRAAKAIFLAAKKSGPTGVEIAVCAAKGGAK